MFNSSVLEIAIGLVFIYLLLSVICTSINEAISTLLNKRGKNLFDGIKNLLNDPGFTGLALHVYNHGLVSGSTQYATDRDVQDREPSYLASSVFSLALTDILGSQGVTGKVPDPLPPEVKPAWDALGVAQQNLTAASAVKDAKKDDLKAASQKVLDARESLITALKTAAAATTDEKVKSALQVYCLHVEATQAAAKVTAFTDTENRQNASAALQKVLANGRAALKDAEQTFASIQAGVQALPAGHTREALLVLIDKTTHEVADGENQLKVLQENIEGWFNDAMDRVGGWYKRWTQKILYVLAALVVCATNADTINILQRLDKKGPEVAAIVTAAENTTAKGGKLNEDAIEKATQKLGLPLGWNAEAGSPQRFPWSYQGSAFWFWNYEPEPTWQQFWASLGIGLLKLTGLAVSVFAVSLGAPFWFDTLSKFVNLRGAGTPPGDTKKSAPAAASVKRAQASA